MDTRRRRRPERGKAEEKERSSKVTSDGQDISRTQRNCWIALFAVALSALAWNQYALYFYSWTDEQILFYVARRLAEGAVLYRDIDSARPPLALWPIALLLRMGWAPLLAGRALVLGAQLATAGLLLWGGWRLASRRAGLLAALLFLTCPEVFDRAHYTGIQAVALTTAACVLYFLRAQPFRSGLFLGLTLATDQHGLVVCGAVALLTLVSRPRDAIRFATGSLVVIVIVFGRVWLMGGRHLWADLFGIHLFHFRLGEGANTQFWEKFTPWLCEHAYFVIGAGLGLALLGFRRKKSTSGEPANTPSRTVRSLHLLVGVHVAVVLAMTEAAFLYVVVIAPMLALLAGIGFDASATWWAERRQASRARARRASRLMLAGATATIALTAAGWAAARSYREHLDERPYSFWPHVLHGQLARFQRLGVAGPVAGSLALPKTGTIFGDPTITTAVALYGGFRVSGDLADLNPTWLEAGTVRHEDVVSRIERDGVAAVVTSPWFMAESPYFRAYLMACYEVPTIFSPPDSGAGSGLFDILVYRHREGASPCLVPRQERQ